MAMIIVTSFEQELSQVLALAAFIPIVMGMGGNIATQSSTIIVRGMATGRVNMGALLGVILKETRVGLLLGIIYGLFLGIVSFFFFQEPRLLGLVVGIAIFGSMALAAMLGTVIPLVLKRFDFDTVLISSIHSEELINITE